LSRFFNKEKKKDKSFKENNTMNFLSAFRQYLVAFSIRSQEHEGNGEFHYYVVKALKIHFANLNALILLQDRQKTVASLDMNRMIYSFIK